MSENQSHCVWLCIFAASQTLRFFDDPEKAPRPTPADGGLRDARDSLPTREDTTVRREMILSGTGCSPDEGLAAGGDLHGAGLDTGAGHHGASADGYGGLRGGRDGRAGGDARAAGDHGGPGHDGGGNGDSSHLDCTVRVYFGVRCRGSLRAFSGAAEPTKVHEASRFGFDQWDFLG